MAAARTALRTLFRTTWAKVPPLVAFAALAAGPAFAHAILTASTPPAGATVPGPVVEFALRFNSRIDRERSRLVVIAADKSERVLPIGEASSEHMLTTAGRLAPGAYRLRWQVLSTDGHITRGDLPFTVGEGDPP